MRLGKEKRTSSFFFALGFHYICTQNDHAMKKRTILLSSILIAILLVLILAPIILKGKLVRLIRQELSTQWKAELAVGSAQASLFKHFPEVSLTFRDAVVTSETKDTLAQVAHAEAALSLKSLIGRRTAIPSRISIHGASLHIEIDTAGQGAWGQPVRQQPEEPYTANTPASPKGKGLPALCPQMDIHGLSISYSNYRESTYANLPNLDFHLSSQSTKEGTRMHIALESQAMSFRQGNQIWMDNAHLLWKTEITGNENTLTYTIVQNDLRINGIPLDLKGEASLLSSDAGRLNLTLQAPDSRFEQLLPLLPRLLPDKQKIQAVGTFNLYAQIQGEYAPSRIPAFVAGINVRNASIQYEGMPEAIRDINLDLEASNPGGPADSTRIRLANASLRIAGSPFHIKLDLANPTNPVLDGQARGIIDFAGLKKAIPLQNADITGKISADLTFQGKYEYIEKEEYEKFTAKGNIELQGLRIANPDFPQGSLSIPQGSLTVTPASLQLKRVTGTIYSSDFVLRGSLSNYLPHIFRNETLKGNFTLTSDYIDLNEFILAQSRQAASRPNTPVPAPSPQASTNVLEIPKNVDIHLDARVGTVIFDNLTVRNLHGGIHLANATASLEELDIRLLGGGITLNGQYDTRNPKVPAVDFKTDIRDIDLREAYKAFTFIRKSIPVAADCQGKVSASMTFAAQLDREMSPLMNTAQGKGTLSSRGIRINNNPALGQLAAALKNNELNRLDIGSFNINFNIENGDITIQPFKTSFAGNPITIQGKQSVKGDLDYTLSMTLHRRFFGDDINNLLKAIPGANNLQAIDLDAKVSGTLDKPTIKPDLTKAINAVAKEAEKALKGNLLEGLQNLFK